jgi:hypothetical protein
MFQIADKFTTQFSAAPQFLSLHFCDRSIWTTCEQWSENFSTVIVLFLEKTNDLDIPGNKRLTMSSFAVKLLDNAWRKDAGYIFGFFHFIDLTEQATNVLLRWYWSGPLRICLGEQRFRVRSSCEQWSENFFARNHFVCRRNKRSGIWRDRCQKVRSMRSRNWESSLSKRPNLCGLKHVRRTS